MDRDQRDLLRQQLLGTASAYAALVWPRRELLALLDQADQLDILVHGNVLAVAGLVMGQAAGVIEESPCVPDA